MRIEKRRDCSGFMFRIQNWIIIISFLDTDLVRNDFYVFFSGSYSKSVLLILQKISIKNNLTRTTDVLGLFLHK